MSPWAHFTNIFPTVIQIQRKFSLTAIQFLAMILLQIFAHAMTAELWCQMQKLWWSQVRCKSNEISIKSELRSKQNWWNNPQAQQFQREIIPSYTGYTIVYAIAIFLYYNAILIERPPVTLKPFKGNIKGQWSCFQLLQTWRDFSHILVAQAESRFNFNIKNKR